MGLRTKLKGKLKGIFERDGKSRGSSVAAGPYPSASMAISETSKGANLTTMASPVSSPAVIDEPAIRAEVPVASSRESITTSVVAGPDLSVSAAIPEKSSPLASPSVLSEMVVRADVLAASSRENILTSDAVASIALQGDISNPPVNAAQERDESYQTAENGHSQSSTKHGNRKGESVDCFQRALILLDPKDLEHWKAMQSGLLLEDDGNNIDKLKKEIQKHETTQAAKHATQEVKSFFKIAKPLVMSLSRLDPHNLAPYISAGAFFAIEVSLKKFLSVQPLNAETSSFSLVLIP